MSSRTTWPPTTTFFDYIKGRLGAKSSYLIHGQLIKIGKPEETTFESENFTQIDQETSISLRSLDRLRLAEIDVLAAVPKLADCEVQSRGLLVNSYSLK